MAHNIVKMNAQFHNSSATERPQKEFLNLHQPNSNKEKKFNAQTNQSGPIRLMVWIIKFWPTCTNHGLETIRLRTNTVIFSVKIQKEYIADTVIVSLQINS